MRRPQRVESSPREVFDPIEAKRVSKRLLAAIPTFEEAATAVHAGRKVGWKNAKHQEQWISSLRTYVFPIIGRLPVDQITTAEIIDVLTPIWLTKPETAKRVMQRIRAVLDWAHSKGHRPTEAPLRSVTAGLPKAVRSQNHFAALPHDQMAALMVKLANKDTTGALALRLLILTAVRSGEVRNAEWGKIDLVARTWTIPASRMKAGRQHVIPLSDAAISVLNVAAKLKKRASDRWVFPGATGKPLSDMTLGKVLRAAMPGKWTVHGCRSTFRDWAAEMTPYSREVAEAALAHTNPDKVEAAYRRTDYLERRKPMMNEWAAYVTSRPPVADDADKLTKA